MARSLVFLVLFIFYYPSLGWACSCVPRSEAEHTKQSDAVFVGTVTQVEDQGASGIRATIEVTEVRKGTPPKIVRLSTPPAQGMCGINFRLSGTYLVFASGKSSDEYSTGLCAGTRYLDVD